MGRGGGSTRHHHHRAGGAAGVSREQRAGRHRAADGLEQLELPAQRPDSGQDRGRGQRPEVQRAQLARLRLRQPGRFLVPVPRQPGPERGPVRPLGDRRGEVPGQRLDERHPGRRELRAQPGPEVRPVRDARHLEAGRGPEHPDPGHVGHGRRDRDHGRREQLQLRRHDRHRLQQAGSAGVHQLLGRRVRLVGRGLRQARRSRRVRPPGRAGLVGGAAADRPPDGPGAVQQPGHHRRHHLVVAGQRLAHHRRH